MFWKAKIGKGGREMTAGPLAKLKATTDARLRGAETIMGMRVTSSMTYANGGPAANSKVEGLHASTSMGVKK